jgi:hypothetical protein
MDYVVEISYYLELSVFLQVLTNEKKNELIECLKKKNEDINYQLAIPTIKCENILERCDDKLLRIALVRQAKDVEVKSNKLVVCKKKKYNFDNVYEINDTDEHIATITDFIKTRMKARKNTSVLTYGYSSSGKSTLIKQLVDVSIKGCSYRLYEIYNNKLYVFMNNLKVIQSEIKKEHIFYCNNIEEVLLNFSKKLSTQVNENSSRSHVVLELIYPDCSVSLIDTAGNEKYGTTENKDESKYINKSLFNVSRFLQNPKHKDNSCLLLNVLKSASNIVLAMMMNDNKNSLANSHLNIFEKLLSYV